MLPLLFAFCLAANTLNPPTNLPIQVLFACLLLTTSPSLYVLAFTLALGLSTVFLFKHGVVQFTKAVSGVNVGAGLRRVRSRLDEGLGKVAGSLMNIKDTVIPGTFGAILVVIITVFAIETKPTVSAALGDGMTIFAFVEDSLVDGSTMDLQDKIPTGQASLQVDKYIKLALGVMVIHASTPVARIAEAMIKIALSFLDNVAHHVESYVCDLAAKFVQAIRPESGTVHAQYFNQRVASAIFDKLDESARTLYRFLTAFEAAILCSATVISFAVKDLMKVLRACWKDDFVTFAQQTKIPVPNIVFFCLDASITILLQICLCMLDMLPSILRWTVRGFSTMALLVELVAHVLLRLWRLSEEWTCSWKAARVNNTDANANTAQDDHSTQVASPQDVALVDVSDETFNSEQTQERSASLVLQGSGMHTSAKTGLELDLLEEGDLERFLYPITSINATTISPQSIASPIYPVGRPECMSTEQEDNVTFAKTPRSQKAP